jgi:hypothetical protein
MTNTNSSTPADQYANGPIPLFCKDCQHFFAHSNPRYEACLAVPSDDLVQGKPTRCKYARVDHYCGKDAKLFVAKTSERGGDVVK